MQHGNRGGQARSLAFNDGHLRAMFVGAIFSLFASGIHAMTLANPRTREDLAFTLYMYGALVVSASLSGGVVSEAQQRGSIGDFKSGALWALCLGAMLGGFSDAFDVVREQLPARTPAHSVGLLLRSFVPGTFKGIAASACSMPLSILIFVVASRLSRTSRRSL